MDLGVEFSKDCGGPGFEPSSSPLKCPGQKFLNLLNSDPARKYSSIRAADPVLDGEHQFVLAEF